MLVVLDTNVLASGFLHSNPTSATVLLIDLWRAGIFPLAISQHILTELSRTFALPYFRERMSDQDVADAQQLLLDEAQLTQLTV
jgi:predicted nucleic acid-binding protein